MSTEDKLLKELKEENKELKIHNVFLLERLDSWADKNFNLRKENEELKRNKPEFAKHE